MAARRCGRKRADPPGPKRRPPYVLRAGAREKAGDHQGAVSDATQAIKLNPRNAGAYLVRQTAYAKLRRFDRGVQGTSTAWPRPTRKAPNGAFSARAIHAEMGDLDKAMAEFTDAIRRDPRSSDAYHRRAAIYFSRKQIPEAISDLDLAIYLDRDNLELYSDRAAALPRGGRVRRTPWQRRRRDSRPTEQRHSVLQPICRPPAQRSYSGAIASAPAPSASTRDMSALPQAHHRTRGAWRSQRGGP